MKEQEDNALDARIRDVVAHRARRQVRQAHSQTPPAKPPAYPAPVRVREWVSGLAFRVVHRRVVAVTMAVSAAFLLLWTLLHEARYEAVSEIRLLSDYKAHPITDMAVDDRYVYLATDGNGLQRYDKQTYLWKTFAVPRAGENPSNSLREVVHDPLHHRLWLLSGDKNIITAADALRQRDVETVLQTGTTWTYFDLGADLRQAFLADDGARLYLGAAGYGAAVYHIPSHTWTPFEGASDTVRYLLPGPQTLWVAGNAGVHAFDRLDGSPDTTRTLAAEDVRHFALGAGLNTAVNAEKAAFAQVAGTWAPPFGGGHGLRGIDAAAVSRALLTPEKHLLVAAEGKGMALYDTARHRWQTLAEPDARYRQLAVLDDRLFVAADTGLRVLSYREGFRQHQRLNPARRVTLRHHNDTRLFYSTEDQALWTYGASQERQLIDAPDEIGPPGAVREVLATRNRGRPGFWLLTTRQGLLRYDSNAHRLEQGPYSFIGGWPRPIDQLFQNGDGLLARVGGQIYQYLGSDWLLNRDRFGVRHVIPVATARFLFLKNNGSLEAINAPERYFNGRTEPLLTALAPSTDGQPAPGLGEVVPASETVYLALPGEAVWAYRLPYQRWERLVEGVPTDLRSIHWNEAAWGLVTQAGRLYVAGDTTPVAPTPVFTPTPLPGPLNRVVDVAALFNDEQVLVAWPDRLARYDPGTGRWHGATLPDVADSLEQLIEWQRGLYVRAASNRLWRRQGGLNDPGDRWHPVGFTDAAIARLGFGQTHIWYRFDDGTAGRFAAASARNAPPRAERFFTGSFPDLERATHLINEDERYVWVLSDRAVGRYDAGEHRWQNQPFPFAAAPGEAVRQALFADGALYVITNHRLIRFTLDADGIASEQRTFEGRTPMVLVPDGPGLHLWLQADRRIDQIDVTQPWQQQPEAVFEGGRFAGNLNQLVDAREHEGALWVADRTGHFGRYDPRTHAWRTHPLPPGETPVRFIPLKTHLLLETRLPDPALRHLYRYDAPRDTLLRLDACRDRPAFRAYPDGPLLLVCQDGTAAQVREHSTDVTVDLLPALAGATRLDVLFVRDARRPRHDAFVGLFADSAGARTVLYGDTAVVALPASARAMNRLRRVVRDAADRLWILSDDERLYVARLRDLPDADVRNLDVRHFERKLRAGAPALDFPAALWGGSAPAIAGFDVYDPSTNVNVWIATSNTVYQFYVPLLGLPGEQRRAGLPRGRRRVQHLSAQPGQQVVVVQEDRAYQLRAGQSWWRRPFSFVAGYNLGDWRSLEAIPPPRPGPGPLEETVARPDSATARWRVTRARDGTLRLAYRPGSVFKDLRHDAHTFLKDHVRGAAAPGRGTVYLHTHDGLLAYDVSRARVLREVRATNGQPLTTLDTLLTKPTGEAARPTLWARHDGQWMEVVEEDSDAVRLVPGAYTYVARRTADDAVAWRQTTPTTATFTLGDAAAGAGGRLLTDVLVDVAVLDSMVFYSTPLGTWWGTEEDGVARWRFATTLPGARFHQSSDGRLLAQTDDGFFELAATGRIQPAAVPLPDTTRAIRRTLEIDGTRWQVFAGQPGLHTFSGGTARRQDAATRAFADDVVRDALFDVTRSVYWVATRGGLWRFDPAIRRANRKTIFAPETDFRRLFEADRRLYAVDAEEQVYTLQAGRWRRADETPPDRLVKTLDNGRIRFTQDHTNTVRLTRAPGQHGPAWTRHERGWRLAGDALENAERVAGSLWTYAPDLGFARYPMGDFSTAETVLRPPAPIPEHVDFFKPTDGDTLYVRDPATARYWRLVEDRLESGAARDWARPTVAAAEGRLVWERPSPDSPTLTLKINGVPLRAPFSNRRLAFDDFRSVFATNDNTVLLGNDAGLFELALTPSLDLRLLDYLPLDEGVEAIAEARGRLFVRTGGGVLRLDRIRRTFEAASADTVFRHAQPVLRFEQGRFVFHDEPRAIPAYQGTLEADLPRNRPLFTPEGTFGFDAYTAMLPLSDSTWLGATACGLVEARTTHDGTHHLTAFYGYDQAFDGAVAAILDVRRHDDGVYLHGRDAPGRDVFFTWDGKRALPYDETAQQRFAHPRVTFHPHQVKWNQEAAPHTDPTVLTLVGDPGYPLYIEDEEAPGRGRFSFDDIQAIWAYDNLLWAGSKGGLLQFRYLPGHTGPRLVFETIYTLQTNLAAYHVLDVQRGARAEPSIDLRLKTPGDTLVKQTLMLGGWHARPLEATFAPVATRGNLTIEQDALGFRTRLRTDAGAALLEGYAFDTPPGKTARLGDQIFFVATDSLLFVYDQTTNASRRVGVVYIRGEQRAVETLRPPLALARYEDRVVVMDSREQVFTMQPGTPPDVATTREALYGRRYASLGDLDLYVQDGQLVVAGEQVPRMRVADAAGRYAIAAHDGQLVLYTGPGHYTVWTYEDGRYTNTPGGEAAAITYVVRPGDTLYGIIAALGLASGKAGDAPVERIKAQIIDHNRGNTTLYFVDGDARLHVNGRIEIPGTPASTRARRPTKGYFYWTDRDSLRLQTPPVDLITRTLYAEDDTHSIVWTGERFVEVERRRNLAQQYYPPEGVAVWNLRRRQDGPLLLLARDGAGPAATYFERERLRLRPWSAPAWDPFVEDRVEIAARGRPVSYRVTARRLLEREGTLIPETDDWWHASPIRRIVALEKSRHKLWIATRDRLIRVDPY